MNLRQILVEVAVEYGASPQELLGPSRLRAHVRPRQEFMWRARQVRGVDGEPRYSLPQIGRFLNRDHTTVLHGLRSVERRRGQVDAATSPDGEACDNANMKSLMCASTNASSDLIMAALAEIEPSQYPARLREILHTTAAALVFAEGKQAAAEALYRVSDALVGVDA